MGNGRTAKDVLWIHVNPQPLSHCHALLPIRESGAVLEGLVTTGIGRFENTIFLLTIAIISQLFASEAFLTHPSDSSTSIAVSSPSPLSS